MARRGPKRLSARELELRGSRLAQQRRREEEAAKERTPRRLDPPKWLSRRAKQIWRRTDGWLQHVRAAGDEAVLASFCQTYADYIEATEMIQRDGLVIKSPKHGGMVKHPAITISNQCRTALVRLASELGLTPSGRERLGWTFELEDPADEPEDEFDKFLGRKKAGTQ